MNSQPHYNNNFRQHPNPNAYPFNYRHNSNFQDPYAAQVAFNHRKNTHPRFQDAFVFNSQSPPQTSRKETDFDPITGQMWFIFDPAKHVKKDNNRLEITSHKGSSTCYVRYRVGHPDQFQTISGAISNSIAPIMEGRVAHSTLMETFKAVSSHTQIDSDSCTMESHIEPDHMVAKILDILKDNLPHIMTAATSKKDKDLFDAFPKLPFGAPSRVNFSLGWTLSGSSTYATFAKDKELDPLDFATQLGMPTMTFTVHPTLLRNERLQRQCILQLFTQLHYFDLYSGKIEEADEILKSRNNIDPIHMNAMAKPTIWLLRYHLKHWISTKLRIRRQILPDRSKPAANALLESNPFECKIFPDKDISNLRKNNPFNNILPALGLSLKRNWPNNISEPPVKKLKTYHTSGSLNNQTNETPSFHKYKDFQRRPNNRGQRSRPGRGRASFRGRGYAYKPKPGGQANCEYNNENREKSYNARDKSYNKDKSQNQEK